ncbi:UDP-glucose 4-epimerase GalE [Pseudoxanthomonas spadix]|uniref:UDP-glucose 4-epimerase GalE n=1 Tax=Pseudoxanthomonas spadix TaxID=415229 RepID=UPI000EFFE04E|nr:UDP-glucose 4-epimerase GalE [Pseudoxanthomonas spadix]MBP3974930.1 UDP-glucose 4-epimerase GalE [Pseudoxanthomonas spadix]RMW98349.1 UDP-glucose 4-epimerase GalE [Pseudoxanthomonas spadix]
MRTVLVTGGAGYVGSHACKAFARAGWQVVALDNLSRGWPEAVRWGPLVVGDIADAACVQAALDQYRPDVVAHFAAYAYVGESVQQPDIYYRNNSVGTLNLLDVLRGSPCRRVIFSSTCASYGHPVRLPIDETHPQAPINPYGWSKFIIERMLEDYAVAYGLTSTSLRYFNAAGCDPEGEIGERHEPETHAIPLAIAAAVQGGVFRVNGTDFDTRDGSAVRDYIHVSDLADAHVLAAERLLSTQGAQVFNLGTGTGTSVLELVAAVERATGERLHVEYGPRRPGDPATLVAAADKARKELGWKPSRSDIDTIVETALAWQRASLSAPA